MKSAFILDERSHQKLELQGHPHISPPSLLLPQEQTLENISPKWAIPKATKSGKVHHIRDVM